MSQDGQTYGKGRQPDLNADKGDVTADAGAEGGQSMELNFTTRNRVNGFGDGTPAPPNDTSWAVPGEAEKAGPEVVAGPSTQKGAPGELAPREGKP